MFENYRNLPRGWQRLIVALYLMLLLYFAFEAWEFDDKLKIAFVAVIASVIYWASLFVILWVVDGFRKSS